MAGRLFYYLSERSIDMRGPITYSFRSLIKLKNTGAVPGAALDALREEADKIMTRHTLCVTMQKIPAASGDPHDYMSVGRYWWPNPETSDGLPYINRDGVVNPDTQDENLFDRLAHRIHVLALAAFYFEDRAYSDYAARQLYDWFLNPETYMNPTARYAQAIPGISDGRGCGLIDFAVSYWVFDSIGILEEMGCLPEATASGIREWYVKLTDWMLTHENGLEEDNMLNNHGIWYDAQILAAAVFTDRPQLAKKICTTAYTRRLRAQIEPDGSQPKELARTKGMNYSLYNLEALMLIAVLAERMGYTQYWEPDPDRGVCILKSAVDFLYPYVKEPKRFPYQELEPQNAAPRIAQMLLRLDGYFGGQGYGEKAAELMDDAMRWRMEPIEIWGADR